MDPMKMPMKKEEKSHLERVLGRKIEERRNMLVNEPSWIVTQQKIAKTKGFVTFHKQLNRTDYVDRQQKVNNCTNEDRYTDRKIPKIYSRFSNAGQAVIPYHKQLPKETKILESHLSSISQEDDSYSMKSHHRYNSVQSAAKIYPDNIDKLNISCSKNKLLKVFDSKAKMHLERDSPERAKLNFQLREVLVHPKDRFTIDRKSENEGYVLDYDKVSDRFPKGVNMLGPKKSYFEPQTLEQLELNDKAINGTKNHSFKI
jgi:hypothetical protein